MIVYRWCNILISMDQFSHLAAENITCNTLLNGVGFCHTIQWQKQPHFHTSRSIVISCSHELFWIRFTFLENTPRVRNTIMMRPSLSSLNYLTNFRNRESVISTGAYNSWWSHLFVGCNTLVYYIVLTFTLHSNILKCWHKIQPNIQV